VFGIVLLWWVFSPDSIHLEVKNQDECLGVKNQDKLYWLIFYKGRNFGIGNETVAMAITVVTAIIAIFTLTDQLFKDTSCSIAVWPIGIH
jgi:hypothetical protein